MTERLQEILNRKPSKWGNLTVKEFEGDIKLLQERVQELEKQSHGIELNLLNDEVVRLEKQNQIYKQALEFYQNGLNYTWKDGLSPVSSSVMIDGGFKARQALKGETE